MELLSPRTKNALDRLTELASGDRLRVLDALARYERKEFKDVQELMDYLRKGGQPDSAAGQSITRDSTKQ